MALVLRIEDRDLCPLTEMRWPPLLESDETHGYLETATRSRRTRHSPTISIAILRKQGLEQILVLRLESGPTVRESLAVGFPVALDKRSNLSHREDVVGEAYL